MKLHCHRRDAEQGGTEQETEDEMRIGDSEKSETESADR